MITPVSESEVYARALLELLRRDLVGELNPESRGVHSNYGVLLSDMKRYDEDEGQYRKAYKLSNEENNLTIVAQVSTNMGFLLAYSLRLDEANSWFERAREGFNTISGEWHMDAIRMLGWIRIVDAVEAWSTGRWEDSESNLKEAEESLAEVGRDREWVSILRQIINIDKKLSQIAESLSKGDPIESYDTDARLISSDADRLIPLVKENDKAWSQLLYAKLVCVKSLMSLIDYLMRTVPSTDLQKVIIKIEDISKERKVLSTNIEMKLGWMLPKVLRF